MSNLIIIDKQHFDIALRDVNICARIDVLQNMRDGLYAQSCKNLQELDDQIEILQKELMSICDQAIDARETLAKAMPEVANNHWIREEA